MSDLHFTKCRSDIRLAVAVRLVIFTLQLDPRVLILTISFNYTLSCSRIVSSA